MTAIDAFDAANRAYIETFPGPRPLPPASRLAVVACMDSRLDLFAALGLEIGDAHLIRNAGGLITDDVLRSLAISQRALKTREIAILHHTQCGMLDFDDNAFRAELEQESGLAPTWDVPGFGDIEEQVARSIAVVRACPWLPHREVVRGFVFDVDSGRVREVVDAAAVPAG